MSRMNLIITTVYVFFSTPNHETAVNIYVDVAHQELHIQEQDLAHDAYVRTRSSSFTYILTERFLLLYIVKFFSRAGTGSEVTDD